MEKNESWLNYLGLVVLCILMIIVGFYFGFRYHESANNISDSKTLEDFSASNDSINLDGFSAGESESKNQLSSTTVNSIEEVFWIQLGKEPNCPETHPIKGKFGSDVNVFYLPDHKSYERVKPEICFKSQKFAEKEAGFLQKF